MKYKRYVRSSIAGLPTCYDVSVCIHMRLHTHAHTFIHTTHTHTGSTVQTKHGNVNTDHILFVCSGAFHSVKPADMLAELQVGLYHPLMAC